MKHKTVGVAAEQFAGLKRKTHSFLVDNNDHKKAKHVNKNVVETISHYEYKDALLNKKCIRHSMNKIQSKNHRVWIYKINKISFSCFDDKLYIQNNEYDSLALGYQNQLEKKNYPNNYLKKLFCQAYCFDLFVSQNSFLSGILF